MDIIVIWYYNWVYMYNNIVYNQWRSGGGGFGGLSLPIVASYHWHYARLPSWLYNESTKVQDARRRISHTVYRRPCRWSDELVAYLNFNELQMADLAPRKRKRSITWERKLFSEIYQLKPWSSAKTRLLIKFNLLHTHSTLALDRWQIHRQTERQTDYSNPRACAER